MKALYCLEPGAPVTFEALLGGRRSPTRAGFGTRLIQHGLARKLGGAVEVA